MRGGAVTLARRAASRSIDKGIRRRSGARWEGDRQATRCALESPDNRRAHDRLVAETGRTDPRLEAFVTSGELLDVLHDPAVAHSRKDKILLALIELYQGGDARRAALGLIMLALFPGLEKLEKRWARTNEERNELWGRISVAFSSVVAGYPVIRRPRKVAANLLGDTKNALWRESRTRGALDRAIAEHEPLLRNPRSPGKRDTFEGQATLADFERPGPEAGSEDAAVEPSEKLDRLVECLKDGERDLVLGFHVYEQPIKALADTLGLKVGAARRRIQRELAHLREDGSKKRCRRTGHRTRLRDEEVE